MGHVMAKSKTKAEIEHLSKVAALGCWACRKIGYNDTPAEIHHVSKGAGKGQRAITRSYHYAPHTTGMADMALQYTQGARRGNRCLVMSLKC